MPKTTKTPEDYIMPLNMNGLQGRMLRLPASRPRGREILLVYGHHAMLERWWGLAQNLGRYGTVTMPDLPGFGGMDSFRKIGRPADIDSYADYLASFIKLRYKRRRLTIFGISYGFVVVTRMLQRYPDLAGRIDLLISAVGFSHYDDFSFSWLRRWSYLATSRVVSLPIISSLFRLTLLNGFVIRRAYGHTHNAKHKFREFDGDELALQSMADIEVKLWQTNDVRTHMATTAEFLVLNNCRQQVPLRLWHIASKNDHYFDNDRVEQHLRIVYSDVRIVEADLGSHITPVIADKKTAGRLLPRAIRLVLSSKSAV